MMTVRVCFYRFERRALNLFGGCGGELNLG
jgi:hypothetical protein